MDHRLFLGRTEDLLGSAIRDLTPGFRPDRLPQLTLQIGPVLTTDQDLNVQNSGTVTALYRGAEPALAEFLVDLETSTLIYRAMARNQGGGKIAPGMIAGDGMTGMNVAMTGTG